MHKREVALTDPVTSPVDPRAARYRAALDGRKASPPVGGGALPPIPLLTGDPPTETAPVPMSTHALRERAALSAPPSPQGAIFQRPDTPIQNGPPGLTMNDILPDEAKQDPNFHEGAGCMYAANQPHLAKKYGVIRGGNRIPPQALAGVANKPVLSAKSIQGLEELAKFQKLREKAASGDLKAEQDAEKGPAAAAARLANAPGDTSTKPLTPEEKKELVDSSARKLDDFDFDTFRQMMMKDLLNNEEQKDIIESRLKPMDLADLIVEGSVAQEVIVIPNKFWVTFRSVSAAEDLAVKRMLMEEARSVQIDDRYYLDKFAFMTLTLGLESINNNPLPSHRDEKGVFDSDMFWRKYDYVTRLNIHMIASLGVNYFWYDTRVRKLVVAERVKNG
jgi:hypothetical protein